MHKFSRHITAFHDPHVQCLRTAGFNQDRSVTSFSRLPSGERRAWICCSGRNIRTAFFASISISKIWPRLASLRRRICPQALIAFGQVRATKVHARLAAHRRHNVTRRKSHVRSRDDFRLIVEVTNRMIVPELCEAGSEPGQRSSLSFA